MTIENESAAFLHKIADVDEKVLRDYFAAKAMQVFARSEWMEFRDGRDLTPIIACAKKSYELADAMLKARSAQ